MYYHCDIEDNLVGIKVSFSDFELSQYRSNPISGMLLGMYMDMEVVMDKEVEMDTEVNPRSSIL
jgi:hypothetical protein